jgi:hypothetical protein
VYYSYSAVAVTGSNVVIISPDPGPAIALGAAEPLSAATGGSTGFICAVANSPHSSQYHHERLFKAFTCRWKCIFLANRFVAFAVPRDRGGL